MDWTLCPLTPQGEEGKAQDVIADVVWHLSQIRFKPPAIAPTVFRAVRHFAEYDNGLAKYRVKKKANSQPITGVQSPQGEPGNPARLEFYIVDRRQLDMPIGKSSKQPDDHVELRAQWCESLGKPLIGGAWHCVQINLLEEKTDDICVRPRGDVADLTRGWVKEAVAGDRNHQAAGVHFLSLIKVIAVLSR